jgi:hypothetical protein
MTKPKTLKIAEQLESGDIHECAWAAAVELRRLHDLLGKSAARIKELEAQQQRAYPCAGCDGQGRCAGKERCDQ